MSFAGETLQVDMLQSPVCPCDLVTSPLVLHCACPGFWVGASRFSTDTDRFRMAMYGVMARFDSLGVHVESWIAPVSHSPITGANFFDGQYGHATFQSFLHGNLLRWVSDSDVSYNSGPITTFNWGQAGRGDDTLAAFVASDEIASPPGEPRNPANLQLSIVDVYEGGCPTLMVR